MIDTMEKADVAAAETSALATINALVPAKVFSPGGIDTLLTTLETEVRANVVTLDISTAKGRKAIASLAYKVARSKTALDDMGKDLAGEWKRLAGLVDADRRALRERLEALQTEVRAPLDAFEAADARRIADHEAALSAIEAYANTEGMTAEAINERIWSLPAPSDRPWQEFAVRAERAIQTTQQALLQAHRDAVQREVEAAETEAAREREAALIAAENEARRIEHEAQIAANARAVALIEAEQAAERDRQAAALALAEAEARVETERVAAARAAEKAEADRIAAAAEAERQQQAAVERERKRQDDIAKAALAETARRERNAAHRKRIHGEILADMTLAIASIGMPPDDAAVLLKLVISAVARDEIRHVNVSY